MLGIELAPQIQESLTQGLTGQEMIKEPLGPLSSEKGRCFALGTDAASRSFGHEVRHKTIIEHR